MGLRIQNNIAAMNTHRQLGIADSALSKSLERLSSGFRINRAADDAAGLSISQQFRADIASFKVASRNTAEATALLSVAEGATDQIANMLTRLKELATQAASANAGSNLPKINAEGNKLIEEIDRIAQSTEYAGSKLLNGTFGVTASIPGSGFTSGNGLASVTGLKSAQTYNFISASTGVGQMSLTVQATVGSVMTEQKITAWARPPAGETKSVTFSALGLTLSISSAFDADGDFTGTIVANTGTASDFQVGSKNVAAEDRIGIMLGSVTTATADLNLPAGQLNTSVLAQQFLTTIDTAIGKLNTIRGDIGAAQNRLMYAAANLATTIENVQAAESVIRDVDMAGEMTTFTKNQILLQASTAMLAQANMGSQNLLSLFK